MNNGIEDLTAVLWNAKGLLDSGYRMDLLVNLVLKFQLEHTLRLSWDEGEELWGSISDAGARILMFHSELPLIFIDKDWYTTFTAFCESNDLNLPIIFSVSKWESPQYRIDTKSVKSFFSWISSISPDAISINDIWFASI